MKTSISQTICLLFFSILIYACSPQESQSTATENEKAPTALPVNQSPGILATPIDSATAVQWAHDWREDHAAWWANAANAKPNAFTLPKADFMAILNEKGVDSIRLYLGLKPTDQKTQELKIIVVGVDSNGDNMFDYSKNDKTYDLSVICPPICGNQNSPLNAGGQ